MAAAGGWATGPAAAAAPQTPPPLSVFAQLRALLRLLTKQQGGGSGACNVTALSAQLEEAADELESCRRSASEEALALRRQAAEREAQHMSELTALQERIGRRDADLSVLHAKLKQARSQLVRVTRQRAAGRNKLRRARAARVSP